MGASNFYKRDAPKYYAVLMDYEQPILDDDGEETEEMESVSPEIWEVNEFIRDIKDSLLERFMGKYYKEGGSEDNDRNYSASSLGCLEESRSFMGVEIGVKIDILLRSGYHEGCNLDYKTLFTLDGYEFDNLDSRIFEYDLSNELENHNNSGLVKINLPKAMKWLFKTMDNLETELNKFLEERSQPLVRTATFSNGETIYTNG